MAASSPSSGALSQYVEYDEETRRRLLCGDLSEETRLPRELLERFHVMWTERARPFFKDVDERGRLSTEGLAEVIRSLGVASALICGSISRVIAQGEPSVDFCAFVRGYAQLHARTLKEALPFAFRVFDLDGDGQLCPEEFQKMLSATLELKKLDAAAIKRVLAVPPSPEEELGGLTSDQFRYFASLSAETILATCGFMLHVNAFYVPPVPLGPEAEEREEEEAAKALRDARARGTSDGAPPLASVGASASGEEGHVSDPVNPFEDEDFLSALESLRTTPEERAERQKNRGNEALRSKEPNSLNHAVERYTEGLGEHPHDAVLVATLLNNRSAAQVMLKNWGRALADSMAALEVRKDADTAEAATTGAAPSGSAKTMQDRKEGEETRLKTPIANRALSLAAQLKAARRGATAALKLDKLDDARALCEEGRRLAVISLADPGSTQLATSPQGAASPGGVVAATMKGEDAEVESLFRKLVLREQEMQLARERAAALAAMEVELKKALRRRELDVSDFADNSLKQQCVGSSSGARVWYDAEADEVHWPVLVLYPETSMSDFIQDMSENDALAEHLHEMFGENAENSPPWDQERKYAAGALQAYICFEDGDGKPFVRPFDASAALGAQLIASCREGYSVLGIPIVHVVVRGSPFEREFLRRGGRA